MIAPLTVVRASIRTDDGDEHSLPPPNRHHHLIALLNRIGYGRRVRGEQGFVLSDGSFASRIRAMQVAFEAGQVSAQRYAPGHQLFSEDLW